MDEVLENFRGFLENKGIKLTGRSLTSLLVLFAVLILLPLSLLLVKQRTNFLPKAEGKWIQLTTAGCVKVIKDNKTADCPLIPLKLINPFFGISNTNSPAPSAAASNNNNNNSPQPSSASPLPSASAGSGSPQNVNVKSFGNNIQQALDSVKQTGGSVFLPAGTYEIPEKVRVYSNTTLFGDGMGATVIKFSDSAFVDDMLSNDTSSGQQNITIRDLTLQGPDIARTSDCCHGLKLENLNGGFVINVEVNDVAMDGIHLGYKIKNGTAQGVSNLRVTGCKVARSQRQQIGFTSGNNVVIDHCTIDGTNKYGAAAYAGIDLEPDPTTTVTNSYVLNNTINGSNYGITLNGTKGESHSADAVRDNKICANNAGGALTGIDDSGTNNTVTDASCDMPGNLSNLPAAPARPAASLSEPETVSAFDGLIKDAFAQDSDDVFTDAQDSDSLDQFVTGGNNATDGGSVVRYRLAETQAGLAQAQWKIFSWAGTSSNIASKPKVNFLSSLLGFLIPKKADAAGGFISAQTFGCGEILEQPAAGATTGEFVFRAPNHTARGWETFLNNGTVIPEVEILRQLRAENPETTIDWDKEPYTPSCNYNFNYNGDCKITLLGKGKKDNDELLQGQTTTMRIEPEGDTSSGCDQELVFRSRIAGAPGEVSCFYTFPDNQLAIGITNLNSGLCTFPTDKIGTQAPFITGEMGTIGRINSSPTKAECLAKSALCPNKENIATTPGPPDTKGLAPNTFTLVSIANAQSPSAAASSDNTVNTTNTGPLPGSSGTASFAVGKQSIDTTYQLKDTKPGFKQIWVQYIHPDGSTVVDSVQFELVPKSPQIVGLACNLDVSKQNLNITIEGARFTDTIGTVESVSPAAKPEVTGWNDKQVTAVLKKPSISITEGQKFKIKVVRADGSESGTAVCAVDKSLVSLGARIFCREPGKFDASNVSVYLVYNPQDNTNPDKLNKIEEKVTIDPDGQIANLKTQLQVGRNYAIAIKAPSSLRRTAVFTAQEGTTEILKPDGSPFILPVGDIAPVISVDGRINTLDRAELIRQWRILGTGETKLTGDFNRDGRVNSIDWACMGYDFGSEDDPLPVSIPQPASGTMNTGGASATITIPGGSASPRPSATGSSTPVPSPSKDTTNSAKIDLGGKLFLDTNRNGSADSDESFIAQGQGTIRLLQLPDSHERGTPLTAEELADAKILTQVSNNLVGANYDISVFVDKLSSNKFSLLATANNGQLTGQVDFDTDEPIINFSEVINIPVAATTQ